MKDEDKMEFCAFDVEGDVGKLGWLGMAFYSDEFQEYTTDRDRARQLIHWHAMQGYTLVAHNAEYDVTVGLWPIDIPVRIVYRNHRFNHAFLPLEGIKKRLIVWDSLGLSGGQSLKRLGESMGLPKLDTPQRLRGIDADRFEWQCTKHEVWECETCYALRDAEICWQYMQSYKELLEVYDVPPKRTIGSAAMSVWRAMENPSPIAISNKETRERARNAYHGGRTETYIYGHVDGVYTADVRSMYPSVMVNLEVPSPHGLTTIHQPHKSTDVFEYEGVSECTLNVPPSHVPLLPCYQTDLLLFPTGTLKGYWTHSELRRAMFSNVQIVQIHSTIYSKSSLIPFKGYIENLMYMRDKFAESNDAREHVVKILLNSLYGRLGLRERSLEERIGPALPTDRINGNPCIVDSWIDGRLFVRINPFWGTAEGRKALREHIPMGEDDLGNSIPNKWANVIWASYVTAAARMRLHDILTAQGQNVIYCDTDSVFSRAPIIGLGDGLGGLKDTGRFDHGLFLGPKLYQLLNDDGDKRVCAKGVPKSVADAYLRGEEVEYTQPVRPKTGMRTGQSIGLWTIAHKMLRTRMPKRYLLHPDWIRDDAGYSETSPLSVSLS